MYLFIYMPVVLLCLYVERFVPVAARTYEQVWICSESILRTKVMTWYPSPHGYQTCMNFVCNKCCAASHIHGLRYTDVSPNAGHRMSCLTTTGYLASLIYRSPLLSIRGWDINLLLWDVMCSLCCP